MKYPIRIKYYRYGIPYVTKELFYNSISAIAYATFLSKLVGITYITYTK